MWVGPLSGSILTALVQQQEPQILLTFGKRHHKDRRVRNQMSGLCPCRRSKSSTEHIQHSGVREGRGRKSGGAYDYSFGVVCDGRSSFSKPALRKLELDACDHLSWAFESHDHDGLGNQRVFRMLERCCESDMVGPLARARGALAGGQGRDRHALKHSSTDTTVVEADCSSSCAKDQSPIICV